jgi:hypothetical protein
LVIFWYNVKIYQNTKTKMVDLNTEGQEPKKLVFESPKAEQDAAVKIADSPHKRWKTFGIIGGVLTLVIAISIASNWGAISQNFTGSFVGIGQDSTQIISPRNTCEFKIFRL